MEGLRISISGFNREIWGVVNMSENKIIEMDQLFFCGLRDWSRALLLGAGNDIFYDQFVWTI
jgi:hypothetical protein